MKTLRRMQIVNIVENETGVSVRVSKAKVFDSVDAELFLTIFQTIREYGDNPNFEISNYTENLLDNLVELAKLENLASQDIGKENKQANFLTAKAVYLQSKLCLILFDHALKECQSQKEDAGFIMCQAADKRSQDFGIDLWLDSDSEYHALQTAMTASAKHFIFPERNRLGIFGKEKNVLELNDVKSKDEKSANKQDEKVF